MIVAHRGASKNAPENTIPAFKLAWKQDADAIECDIHLTKDGNIVCIHDSNTKRVSNKDLVIHNATLEELRKVDVGVLHSQAFKNTIIPTIAEVFSTIPKQKKIYIEIKCGKEIIPALLKEIRKSGLNNKQILVISFNEEVIKEFKQQAPELKASLLYSINTDNLGKTSPSLETVLTTLKQIKADGLSSNKNITDEAFVKSIMAEGYEYHVWTIDNPETARQFNKLGAKSITTNVPDYIRRNLI